MFSRTRPRERAGKGKSVIIEVTDSDAGPTIWNVVGVPEAERWNMIHRLRDLACYDQDMIPTLSPEWVRLPLPVDLSRIIVRPVKLMPDEERAHGILC